MPEEPRQEAKDIGSQDNSPAKRAVKGTRNGKNYLKQKAAYAKMMASKEFEMLLTEYRRIGGPTGHELLTTFAKRGKFQKKLVESFFAGNGERGKKESNKTESLSSKTGKKKKSGKRKVWTKCGLRIKCGASTPVRISDGSLFAKKRSTPLTAEQKEARDRANRRGFHEGAHVPGSNLRKIEK